MAIIRLKENDRAMRYKSYEINASENEPGKWLAKYQASRWKPHHLQRHYFAVFYDGRNNH